MNWIQKKALEFGLKGMRETSSQNELFRQIYHQLSVGQVVGMEDNSESYILNGYQGVAVVYSIIDFISQKASRVPLVVYERQTDGSLVKIPDHELVQLIQRPNAYQGKGEFLKKHFSYKLSVGNGYIYGPRLTGGLNKGKTKELHAMPAQYTEIISGGWMNPVRGYKVYQNGSVMKEIGAEDVLHDKYVNLDFGNGRELYGMSPLRSASNTIKKAQDSNIAQMRSYQNQGAMGMITPKSPEAPFTEAQALQLDKTYKKKYTGASKKGSLMFAPVPLEFSSFGLSSVDMEIIEDMKATMRELCNIYHFPSGLLNDPDQKTYNSQKEQRKALYTDAVNPLVEDFCDEVNRWLTPSYGEKLILAPDYSQIPEMQEDRKILAETYGLGVDKGAYSRNELRQKLGDDEIQEPGMDERTVPLNLQKLTDVTDDVIVPGAQEDDDEL